MAPARVFSPTTSTRPMDLIVEADPPAESYQDKVLVTGVEPARSCDHCVLNAARLPIRHTSKKKD